MDVGMAAKTVDATVRTLKKQLRARAWMAAVRTILSRAREAPGPLRARLLEGAPGCPGRLEDNPATCPGLDFPCYNRKTGACYDDAGKDREPPCPRERPANRVACANMWPRFPCYDAKKQACYDVAGTAQVADPVADCVYAVAVGYTKACDALTSVLGGRKLPARLTRRHQRDAFDFLNANWSYFVGAPAVAAPIVDYEYARLVPVEEYAEQAVAAVAGAGRKKKKRGPRGRGERRRVQVQEGEYILQPSVWWPLLFRPPAARRGERQPPRLPPVAGMPVKAWLPLLEARRGDGTLLLDLSVGHRCQDLFHAAAAYRREDVAALFRLAKGDDGAPRCAPPPLLLSPLAEAPKALEVPVTPLPLAPEEPPAPPRVPLRTETKRRRKRVLKSNGARIPRARPRRPLSLL